MSTAGLIIISSTRCCGTRRFVFKPINLISNSIIFSRYKSNSGSTTTTTASSSSELSSITSSNPANELTNRINASVNLALNKPSEVPSALAEARADILSGVPGEVATNRKVRIYRPCKTAMQSGTKQTHKWKLDFDVLSKWENPTMGWTSS